MVPTTTHLAPFGHGLSYTSFEYSDLRIDKDVISREEQIRASVTVRNSGDRPGKEAVLWYISDLIASITPPVKKLRHFDKKFLLPGESLQFEFEILPNRDLGFFNGKGEYCVEPGDFVLRVGNLSCEFVLLESSPARRS